MSQTVKHDEVCWTHYTLYINLGMCGCGLYDERLVLLKEALVAFPLYEPSNVPEWINTPLGEWFLCLLDKAELIEHGTSIGGSWLTSKGTRLLKALSDDKIWETFQNDTDGLCNDEDCEVQKTT